MAWKSIKKFDRPDGERVDVWMYIYASPRSFGMSDAFKVERAWREKRKWFHLHNGEPTELYNNYITHWSPIPSPDEPPPAPKVSLW
jgi:hypothetical protein